MKTVNEFTESDYSASKTQARKMAMATIQSLYHHHEEEHYLDCEEIHKLKQCVEILNHTSGVSSVSNIVKQN